MTASHAHHDHHHHDHQHGHGRAFAIGVVLNLAFVAIEGVAGILGVSGA